jgi:hypothetical protein
MRAKSGPPFDLDYIDSLTDFGELVETNHRALNGRYRPSASGAGGAKCTASALQRMAFPPIKYIVPGYLVEGCTLFAGAPKLGKSWLALETAIAVAGGGKCLGIIRCEHGDVLYLALEDNLRRLQSRMRKLITFGDDWPSALQFMTECPRANVGGIDQIREWAASVTLPRLVIVDVLAMFKPVRGEKDAMYDADYASIKSLQALAAELGIAILVVHHTRKSHDQVDPFEKVSGTLGLSGAADSTLILSRDQNGVTIYGRGRDIPEIETAVAFDRDTCKWRIIGEAAEVRKTDERKEILDVLKDADEPMSPSDLTAATGMQSGNLRQLLFKMTKDGEVMKSGRGQYIHPDRRDLDNRPPPDNIDNKVTNEDDLERKRPQNQAQVVTIPPLPVTNEYDDEDDDERGHDDE